MTMSNDLFPQHGDLVEIVPYKGYLFNCNDLTQPTNNMDTKHPWKAEEEIAKQTD